MSFGDYSKSNFDSIQKADQIKKATNAENKLTEFPNYLEKENNDTTKPIVQNNVQAYKDSGEPKMLDFGIFDYKNNQKSLPEQLKGNDIEPEITNADLGKFELLDFQIPEVIPYDFGSPVVFDVEAEGKVSLEIIKGMQKAAESMKEN